jgi:tetratricopeptide (TPR) repeat protein
MSNAKSPKSLDEDVERALLDADLFIKYNSTRRAVETLQEAVTRHPRSVLLREKLREVALAAGQRDEAARQCLALANLYIAREDFDAARERLLEARQIDARISISSGFEAIRRASLPTGQREEATPPPPAAPPPPPLPPQQTATPAPESAATPAKPATLSGDLSAVSIFDAVQVIENARLTGALVVEEGGGGRAGRVLFNEGLIVDAECGKERALEAFRHLIEVTAGTFDFEKSETAAPVRINASSNTSLILDSLREIDEERHGL